MPPHCKLVAVLGFVVVVVSTPREAVWAFAAYAALLGAVAAVARVSPWFVLRRLVIEVPFVAFAFLMPFVVPGEQTRLLGVEVSVPGLWGAWNVLAKAPSASPRPCCSPPPPSCGPCCSACSG
jgi:cobalt/nickel transport system permease protein